MSCCRSRWTATARAQRRLPTLAAGTNAYTPRPFNPKPHERRQLNRRPPSTVILARPMRICLPLEIYSLADLIGPQLCGSERGTLRLLLS
jgi:hypothetical protein